MSSVLRTRSEDHQSKLARKSAKLLLMLLREARYGQAVCAVRSERLSSGVGNMRRVCGVRTWSRGGAVDRTRHYQEFRTRMTRYR